MKNKQTVAVVIVNWNKGELTKQCVERLRQQTLQPTQVIVVDNGSDDKSAESLKQLNDVELVWLKTNKGFAGGMNAGFTKVKSQFVLLLNNDCVLADDWLQKAMSQLVQVDLVGGIEYQYQSTSDLYDDQLPYKAAPVIDPDAGITYETNTATKLQIVPYTTASNVLMRSDLFRKLGGFDDRFFAYYEDVDMCARAYALGKKVAVSSSLKAWHASGTTAQKIPYKIAFLKTRNRYYYLYKQASDKVVSRLPRLIRREWIKNSLKLVAYPIYALKKSDHESFKQLRGQWKAYAWLRSHRQVLEEMRFANKSAGTYSEDYWQYVARDYKERSI